jgi:MFS family permease
MRAARQRIFYGWNNVAVGFTGMALSYAMFTIFVFGTFVKPLEAEFGWQRGELSFAYTMTNIGVVLASPLLGFLVDRLGVRRVLLPSLVLMALAVASMAFLQGQIWHFYLMYLLIPILGAGTLPQSYSRVIIAWFSRRRGIALGVTLAGFGVGAALVPAFAQYMIEHHGWRMAYLAFAAAIVCIALPMALFLLRETPAEMGLQPDGDRDGGTDPADAAGAPPTEAHIGLTGKEAARTRSFWLILMSFLLVGVGITSILAHLVPMLIGRGVDPEIAALCMSSLGLGLIFGRVMAGFLMDRFFAPYVTAIFLLGLVAGILTLATGTSGPQVFLAAVLVGLATGSEIGEIAYIVSRYFGPRAFALIYGIMFAAFQIGSAFGPPLMGFYYDRAGNYIGALWVIAGIVLAGTVLIVLLGRYPDLRSSSGRRPGIA